MAKPTRAQVNARTEEFVQIILDGAEPHDLRHYVTDRQAAEAVLLPRAGPALDCHLPHP